MKNTISKNYIKILIQGLDINDLTNYPFTKNLYELNDIKKLTRHKII